MCTLLRKLLKNPNLHNEIIETMPYDIKTKYLAELEKKAKEEKEAQAFREDIDYFLSKDEFNLFDFHERVLVSVYLVSVCLSVYLYFFLSAAKIEISNRTRLTSIDNVSLLCIMEAFIHSLAHYLFL